MTERDKLEAGMWYDANYDEELRELRGRAQGMCLELSRMAPDDPGRAGLISDLLGYEPDHLDLVTPFMCDYGTNIRLGSFVFLNTNCYLMDCAPITIGSHVFVGPFCGFYTATHPLEHRWRNLGLERALPISVGDNCWFGANVSVMPGVTIGSGCVIAAGAVVTRDVPDNVLVAGVPARIVRTIDQDAPLSEV